MVDNIFNAYLKKNDKNHFRIIYCCYYPHRTT